MNLHNILLSIDLTNKYFSKNAEGKSYDGKTAEKSSAMVKNGKLPFFYFEAVTLKLAQIVLINDRNNMCKGISGKLKIEHKREKCNMHHPAGAVY